MHSTQVTTLSTDSIAQFRSSLSVRGRSEHTVKSYASDLTMFLSEAGRSSVPILELEEEGMKWLTDRRQQLAPRTTQRRLTSLRAFARWAGQGQMFLDYKPPTALKHIPDPLPEGMPGVHRLIDTATDWRLKTIVGLCGLAGLRISESLSIGRENIDFRENLLTVRGKGDKERTVPFGDKLSDILMDAVMRSMGQTVLVDMGDRLARRTITRLGKRAKLKREIASHQLRATFATHLLTVEGVDIRTIQELLGHANVTTTQGYTGVTLNRMRDAVKGL